jgi:hypothetical protein
MAMRDGFEDRAEGDYGLVVISREQASAGIAGAQRFVIEMKRRLAEGPLPETSPES